MRVAEVIQRFSFEHWGGTEAVVWNLARELKQLGEDSEILAIATDSFPGPERREGLSIHRFREERGPDCAWYRWLRERWRRKPGGSGPESLERYLRDGGFDLIHCHRPGPLATRALAAARSAGAALVVSLYEGELPTAPAAPEAGRGSRPELPDGPLRELLTGADGLVCQDREQLSVLHREFPEKPVLMLPDGVAPEYFSTPSRLQFRTHYSIPPERRLLLCVSRIAPSKNQLALIELTRALVAAGEEVQTVLIGAVDSKTYVEELRRSIRRSGLEDRVLILPGLRPDSAELLSAYQAADLFVLPSVRESFGIVVLEAWSAGLPVLASRIDGLPELVTDGVDGVLFDPGSPEQLYAAARRVLHDPELAECLAANGRAKVAAHYTWSRVAAELNRFYRSLRHPGVSVP